MARNYCPHCSGIIGMDCFNVEECGEITRQMEAGRNEDQAGIIASQASRITLMAEALRDALAFITNIDNSHQSVRKIRSALNGEKG